MDGSTPRVSNDRLYVLQSDICLHLQIQFWRNFDAPDIWNVENCTGQVVMMVLYIVGFLILFTATFALDNFHMFGLAQGLGIDINHAVGLSANAEPRTSNTESSKQLVTRWHNKFVAHPLVTGWLIMFWVTPTLSLPRFLLAAVNSFYILSHFEEVDLSDQIGPEYVEYMQAVPRFIPGVRVQKRTPSEN